MLADELAGSASSRAPASSGVITVVNLVVVPKAQVVHQRRQFSGAFRKRSSGAIHFIHPPAPNCRLELFPSVMRGFVLAGCGRR